MTKRKRLASFCCECGPNVKVDEDGLCAGCGATAMGSAMGSIRLRDPAAERVVRAAVAMVLSAEDRPKNGFGPCNCNALRCRLRQAVEALERKGRKK